MKILQKGKARSSSQSAGATGHQNHFIEESLTHGIAPR
jgi:hypothetical protein